MTLGDFLWAIPVFGILIFIHELGHFSVAKWFHIRVHEFALGFGPVIAGFEKDDTRYNLRLIPLGGFVRMAGMEDGDLEDPNGFNKKPLYARSLVIAAGPIMNFVLASIFYSAFLFVSGTVQVNSTVLGPMTQYCDTMQNGSAVQVVCPAYSAGLRQGDRVLKVNGVGVSDWASLRQEVSQSAGKPVLFQIERGKETREIQINPILSDSAWIVGIQASSKPVPLLTALAEGPVMTGRVAADWAASLWQMVVGKLKPQFSGPVGITKVIAEEAAHGIDNLLVLTGFLSINLGMFNLLPIPALDGSRLMFMLVEAIRGRRLDPQRENMVHFVGFVLLIGLMVVITYSEVVGH